MRREAVISDCGRYRYSLTRDWGGMGIEGAGHKGRVLWVMLNPSTADGRLDDPTIRKCIGFSERWGYGSMTVVNLFAWRATDPDDLVRAHTDGDDIVGPLNDGHIKARADADLIVAAWGKTGGTYSVAGRQRWRRVLELLGPSVQALKLTKHGHPWHPLYAPYTSTLVPFEGGTR